MRRRDDLDVEGQVAGAGMSDALGKRRVVAHGVVLPPARDVVGRAQFVDEREEAAVVRSAAGLAAQRGD